MRQPVGIGTITANAAYDPVTTPGGSTYKEKQKREQFAPVSSIFVSLCNQDPFQQRQVNGIESGVMVYIARLPVRENDIRCN